MSDARLGNQSEYTVPVLNKSRISILAILGGTALRIESLIIRLKVLQPAFLSVRYHITNILVTIGNQKGNTVIV